ncbi:hypothetical protein UY3_15568 [Chelonia mydas]|uniref:Uncharacterized protein n=1 Tax=Chelonia mydas TaxID=8469 RepID=M7AWE9_CHEMY|nr:hypothetical protein UY3_15568 [Chelonia mydas]
MLLDSDVEHVASALYTAFKVLRKNNLKSTSANMGLRKSDSARVGDLPQDYLSAEISLGSTSEHATKCEKVTVKILGKAPGAPGWFVYLPHLEQQTAANGSCDWPNLRMREVNKPARPAKGLTLNKRWTTVENHCPGGISAVMA